MNKKAITSNRRRFLKTLGASSLPLLISPMALKGSPTSQKSSESSSNLTQVNFISDGLMLSPKEYLEKLNAISKSQGIQSDYYGYGGVVKNLEDEFAKITGKEKAIYLPSGTMANQLAIKLLNGNNTKVVVPENSHVYRDEADAAQSVHNLRLIPLGKEKANFNLSDLRSKISELDKNEVFKSGLGTVVIENPVRRAKGAYVPLNTIQEISAYCKQQGYKLHLDGARLHIASVYSGVDVKTYASYFDTVYISLYKYLNAAGGAILCGPEQVINQVAHQIKIHGGTIYQNWPNAAMALHYLKKTDGSWNQTKKQGATLIAALNKIEGVQILPQKNGTNIYDLILTHGINLSKLSTVLRDKHNIKLLDRENDGVSRFALNESILNRPIKEIVNAWEDAIDAE